MTADVTLEAPFVPAFDDEADAGRKLAVICSKGNLDMAYPGLILGNAALGEGIEVHLFFTFWGFDMINKKTQGSLQFSYLGNTAMHPPGMFGVHMPQGMAGLPGMTAATTKMMKKQIADLDVPEVPEFLEMIHASGGISFTFPVCRILYRAKIASSVAPSTTVSFNAAVK